nr:flagellar hook-length control protein FliK [Halomonas dongshanensis]
MHQVLGRRGEESVQRLAESVRPVAPGDGPRAVQGDARLDGKPDQALLQDLRRLPPALETLARSDARAPGAADGASSTQTHFSPAARGIADLLLRFPAPPAALRPEAPLLAGGERVESALLATRLEASVRDSGLFFESHLKRWFQGDMSRAQLQREPQMQLMPRPAMPMLTAAPAAPALVSVLPPSAPLLLPPGVTLVPVAATPTDQHPPASAGGSVGPLSPASMPTAPKNAGPAAFSPTQGSAISLAAQGEERAEKAAPSLGNLTQVKSPHAKGDIVHESVQSLVRHQLEMLVVPTLRWEGEVWAGLFMALTMHLPMATQDNGAAQRQGRDECWRSEMQLDVPSVGRFTIALLLVRNILSLDFTAAEAETLTHIEVALPALERRLSALSFDQVRVHARQVSAGEGDE